MPNITYKRWLQALLVTKPSQGFLIASIPLKIFLFWRKTNETIYPRWQNIPQCISCRSRGANLHTKEFELSLSDYDALDVRFSTICDNTMGLGLVMDAYISQRGFMILGTLLVLLGVVTSQGRLTNHYNLYSLILACFLLCGSTSVFATFHLSKAVLELYYVLFIWTFLCNQR